MVEKQGTVISGTHQLLDLVGPLADKLDALDYGKYHSVTKMARSIAEEYKENPERHGVSMHELLEILFDCLNDEAPEGMYFGAHPGDGADFGFWEVQEN